MAKRRKKKSTGRRRRVGATSLNPNNPIIKFGVPLLGYFMGDKINAQVDKLVGSKVDGKIIGAGEAGLGAFLTFGKGKKSLVKSIAGGLLLGAGAKKLMSEFGIGGIGNTYGRVPVIGNTYGRVPVIAGARRVGAYTPNQALNGYTPNQSLNGGNRSVRPSKIMAGVSTASGSSMSNQPGSNMMN